MLGTTAASKHQQSTSQKRVGHIANKSLQMMQHHAQQSSSLKGSHHSSGFNTQPMTTAATSSSQGSIGQPPQLPASISTNVMNRRTK